MNRFQLWAELAEREVMRYSPAGVPIINARLNHVSRQLEAGVEREVQMEINALAAGEMAQRMEQLALGKEHFFSGFLARKSRNSKSLVFHIIDLPSQDGY